MIRLKVAYLRSDISNCVAHEFAELSKAPQNPLLRFD